MIIHASHVGFDAERQCFGVYERLFTADSGHGHNCGKLCAVMQWYRQEYDYACAHVLLGLIDGKPAVFIDNHLVDQGRREGLFLNLPKLIGGSAPLRLLATSTAFLAADYLVETMPAALWGEQRRPIADRLAPELFSFRRDLAPGVEGPGLLEAGLTAVMPELMASPHPALDAARHNTQVEFDRTYRSLRRRGAYHGKNLLFISGLNIDVSPRPDLPFPLTKFVPWAAYIRLRDQEGYTLEQPELFDALSRQARDNPDQMSFDAAIHAMAMAEEVKLPPVD